MNRNSSQRPLENIVELPIDPTIIAEEMFKRTASFKMVELGKLSAESYKHLFEQAGYECQIESSPDKQGKLTYSVKAQKQGVLQHA